MIRRFMLGVSLAAMASAASAQVTQTGSVFWNGSWGTPQPTTQYLQSCNGGLGGIVGQGSCTAGGGSGAGFATTPDQGSGASTANTLRVVQSTDSLVGLRAGTNAIGSITNTTFAATNAGTFAVQNTAATPAGTNTIGSVIALGSQNAALGQSVLDGGLVPADGAIPAGSPYSATANGVFSDTGASSAALGYGSIHFVFTTIGAGGTWSQFGTDDITDAAASVPTASLAALTCNYDYNTGSNAPYIGSIVPATGTGYQCSTRGFPRIITKFTGITSGTYAATVHMGKDPNDLRGTYVGGGTITAATGSPVSAANATGTNVAAVADAPSSAAAAGIVETTVTTTGNTFKNAAGNLYGWDLDEGATAAFFCFLDVATTPTSGATITPKFCISAGINSTSHARQDIADGFSTGITVVSTSSQTTYTPVTEASMGVLYK